MRVMRVASAVAMFIAGLGSMGVGRAMPSAPPVDTIEKKGCCSHHKGVCGCDANSGSLKCCDGTLSPTCGC